MHVARSRRHGAPGKWPERGVEPQIQIGGVMTVATGTRQLRAWCVLVFIALASAGATQTLIGKRIELFQDSLQADLMGLVQVVEYDAWEPANQTVPALGLSDDVSWVRLKLDSRSENGQLIEIQNAGIDELTGYMVCDGKVIATYNRGVLQHESNEGAFGTYPTFPIPLVECEELYAVFRMKSTKPLLLPTRIAGPREVLNDAHQRDILFAAYFGVILVMLLYNLFLFFSVGDRSYLEYSLFIFMIGGTQLVLNGYAPYFNVEAWPWLNTRITHFFGVFSGLTTIVFAQNFLRLSRYVPWLHKLLNGYFIVYVVALVLAISGQLVWAYNVINFCAAAIFFLIPGAIITMRKGYSPAKYFLLAFSIFIVAVLVFVMKDAGVIPYNVWTFFALPLGSAIEMVLLSLALASRINQLKKESAHAREEQLRISQINERMVREQNTKLEERVRDRTADLEEVNTNMRTTLEELQSAQQQLVQSEKLASIGQLTAGIAHELNNPINFVSSSAQSLRRDFEDINTIIELVKAMDPSEANLDEQVNGVKEKLSQLDIEFTQQEIEELLNGIEDGTIRTSEIVKGLRIFSRMDGDNFIQAQLNELIESTLIVLRSNFKDAALLQLDLGEEMPPVMCQPGRLNQVFMNIITNAIQAMDALGRDVEENILAITTDRVDSIGQAWAEVRIKDTGQGMAESVKSQIFDPFYTTKPVGEGTGLGLSIVMGILRDHNAEVEVESEEGVGTEFTIRFPL
ncbi:MAG: hypothetical protein CL828_06720 [Crocinitomicaceae bacterium]|nr:hypothetical protein [Crocinitomicaceae bacterium]